MSAPKDHAIYAASSSDRWVNCPASIQLIEKAPTPTESPAAIEGTNAHDLMELCLKNGMDVRELKGQGLCKEKYPIEMREHVQGYVNYVRSLNVEGMDMLIEERVTLPFLHKTEAFGTVDTAIIEPFGNLHIIDFKYGQGWVPHTNNSQMIYYALGLAHKFKYDFGSVTTTIYQPRAGSTDTVRSDTFSVEKLKSWTKIYKDAIATSKLPYDESNLNAGSWCKFCPAKIICPAISKSNFEIAKIDFDSPVYPEPNDLTPTQIKTILDRADYIDMWVKDVRAYAEQMIRSGHKIRGWGLESKKAQRVWSNPDLVELEYPDLMIPQLASPAQAEKILKASGVPKEDIQIFLNDNVSHVSSGDKLSQLEDYGDSGLDDLIFN